MGTSVSRLVVTTAAADLLRRLWDTHGALLIHQSGGCCDGSSPMCFPHGEFIVGDRDVLLGMISVDRRESGDQVVPVWISGPQFTTWQHTQMVLDVVPGRGSGFSLEAPDGVRFLSRGRAFTQDELAALAGERSVTGTDFEAGQRVAWAPVVDDVATACPVPAPRV